MFWTILQGLVISLLCYAGWKFLRQFFITTSLSNIPGPPRVSWLKGNLDQIYDRRGWQFHLDMVTKYGGAVKVYGPLGTEELYVSDPQALHNITLKEQHIYDETPGFYAVNKMIFGTSLVTTKGEHHRRQRKMLNPVFSVKHMRDLVGIFYPIAHNLREVLVEKVKKGEEEINVLMWMSRAALEYISQGGMGYKMDSLEENSSNEYNEAVKLLTPSLLEATVLIQYGYFLKNFGTSWIRKKVLDWIPSPTLQRLKTIVGVMDKTSVNIFNSKKEALEKGEGSVVDQVGQGKDILAVLLKANMAADEKDRLPEEELIGQLNTFIFAGHDSTSTALSRILHILTLYPEAQVKLRQEVSKARKEHGDMDYDTLVALPYLDAVCREVLRLYPPAPLLNRWTTEDTVLPLMFPITSTDDKSSISEIPLKKGTRIIISILGANRSKHVWGDDAEEFKPERWLDKSRDSVQKVSLPGVYSSMMTFFGGSRACIGFKFSELEMKLVLSILVDTFEFSLEKEIEWNMGGVQTPAEKNSDGLTPSLPLKLKLI